MALDQLHVVLDRLKHSSLYKNVLKEEADTALAARKKQRAALDEARARERAQRPALDAEEREAQLAHIQAGEQLAAARARLGKAQAARMVASGVGDRLERQLRHSAPPALVEFVREVKNLHDRVRATPVERETDYHRSPIHGTMEGVDRTTCKAIGNHMAEIRQVIKDASALELEPLSSAELAKKLAALRAKVGKPRQYEKR